MFYTSGCKPDFPFDGKLVWRVPLPNIAVTQARDFINYIYLQEESIQLFQMDLDEVCGMLEILHRLDCPTALQKLDVYLSSQANCNGKPKDWVSPAVFYRAGGAVGSHACLPVKNRWQ